MTVNYKEKSFMVQVQPGKDVNGLASANGSFGSLNTEILVKCLMFFQLEPATCHWPNQAYYLDLD